MYDREVKRLIHFYMKRGSPVTLEELKDRRKDADLSTKPSSEKSLSPQEIRSALETLQSLGSEGWYEAKPRTTVPERRESLSWIWAKQLTASRFLGDYELAGTLFEDTTINELNLSGYSLNNACFRSSRLLKAQFQYVKAESSTFQYAILDDANFTGAKLRGSRFDRASLIKADFGNTALEHANLELSDLRGANFRSSILRNANLFQADVSRAGFEKADLTESNLGYAKLEDADLTDATVRGADFRSASLKGVELSGADFSSANFTKAHNLDDIRGCYDANFADVIGLTLEEFNKLIERGAVSIPDPHRWRAYKSAGRPHLRWREFADARAPK
jgi:uncharacterized protein YjbI with pentapeptide repeats